MNIYRVWQDSAYRVFEPKDNTRDNRQAYNLCGERIENWVDVPLVASKHTEQNKLPLPDISFVNVSTLLLNAKSYDILHPYIKEFAQFFEISTNCGQWYAVNVTNIVDCLDLDNSRIQRFPSTGRVMRIDEYVFHDEAIKDNHLFLLPESRNSFPYATEYFKGLVEGNGLTGIKFISL